MNREFYMFQASEYVPEVCPLCSTELEESADFTCSCGTWHPAQEVHLEIKPGGMLPVRTPAAALFVPYVPEEFEPRRAMFDGRRVLPAERIVLGSVIGNPLYLYTTPNHDEDLLVQASSADEAYEVVAEELEPLKGDALFAAYGYTVERCGAEWIVLLDGDPVSSWASEGAAWDRVVDTVNDPSVPHELGHGYMRRSDGAVVRLVEGHELVHIDGHTMRERMVRVVCS